jgi:hypothetical protein
MDENTVCVPRFHKSQALQLRAPSVNVASVGFSGT